MCSPCCIISQSWARINAVFFVLSQLTGVVFLLFFFFFLLRAPFRPFVQICGWAGPRVELSAGVNLHMVLIDWLGDACESEMCINVVSCGQAFTVSDSPWKLCLWWVQTAGSPSFLIPLTPWHRRSICWADSTTTKDSEKHKMHSMTLWEWKCLRLFEIFIFSSSITRCQTFSAPVANTRLDD